MAATITRAKKFGGQASAPTFLDTFGITMDASYPTGGEAADFSDTLPPAVIAALITGEAQLVLFPYTGAHYGVYDAANAKVKVYLYSTGVEVGNGVDLTGVILKALVIY